MPDVSETHGAEDEELYFLVREYWALAFCSRSMRLALEKAIQGVNKTKYENYKKHIARMSHIIHNYHIPMIALAQLSEFKTRDQQTNKQQPNTKMKNIKLNLKKTAKAGFSLVEMLVVIAVIGVIAAIAIPNIGSINDSAKDASAQRNAQSVASVLNAAAAAGVDLAAAGVSDAASAISVAASGVSPSTGSFANKIFTTGAMTDPDGKIAPHLTFSSANNQITYDPN